MLCVYAGLCGTNFRSGSRARQHQAEATPPRRVQAQKQRERPGVVVKEPWLACGDRAHALQSDEAEEFYGRRSDSRHAEIVRRKADVARVGVRTTPGVEVERLNLLFQIVWIERHHADVENFSGGKLRGAHRVLHRTSDAEALHSSRPNFEVG